MAFPPHNGGGIVFSPPYFQTLGGESPPHDFDPCGGNFPVPPPYHGGGIQNSKRPRWGGVDFGPNSPPSRDLMGGKSLTPPHISLLPPIYEGGIAKIWGGVAKFCLLPPIILGGESKTQNVLDGGELILNPTPPHILRPWGGNILLPPIF